MVARKTRGRGKPAPKKDVVEEVEEVKEEEVLVEDTTETVEDDSQENGAEANDEEEEEHIKLTPEEKLERIGNVSPCLLFQRLCEKANHPQAYFNYDTQETAKTMACEVHFMGEVIKVEGIAYRSWRSRITKAKNVAADLFLKHLYGDEHELDSRIGEDHTSAISEDAEWWEAKKVTHLKRQTERSERIVKKIEANDDMTEEKKVEQTARVEGWKVMSDELPSYDELHSQYDHPYGPILARSCRNAEIKFVRAITKTSGGTAEEMDARWKIPRNISAEEGVEWKVRIDIKGEDGADDLMAYEAESEDLHEACSTAAYSCLQQLLEEGHVKRLIKSNSELARLNPNMKVRTGGRFGNKTGGRGQQNNRNGRNNKQTGKQKNADKLAADQAVKQQKQMAKQMQKMMGGMAMPGMQGGGQQMMMMPVMMNAQGQMVIMGQPPVANKPTGKNKKRNNKRKGAKNNDEPAEKVSAN